jgi:hypothetical protein
MSNTTLQESWLADSALPQGDRRGTWLSAQCTEGIVRPVANQQPLSLLCKRVNE